MRRSVNDEAYRSRFGRQRLHSTMDYYSYVWHRTKLWAVPLFIYGIIALRARYIMAVSPSSIPSLSSSSTSSSRWLSSLTGNHAKIASSLLLTGRSLLWPLLCASSPAFRHHMISVLSTSSK
jgi:hypothetical protein